MVNQFEALSLGIGLPFEPMKFTLTYDGNLPAAGRSNNRTKEKWAIRNQLHPQLKELWLSHPILNRIQKVAWIPKQDSGIITASNIERKYDYDSVPRPLGNHVIDLASTIQIKNNSFRPLVRNSLDLACGLNILFLRKQAPGSIVKHGGDLDNRIKTLFDGLKMPSIDDDIPQNDGPSSDPLYCLLEDDSLITDCDIRTDRLLSSKNSSMSDVRLIIEVRVKVMRVQPYNLPILSD